MDVSLLVWSLTVGAILLLVVVDLLTVSAKPHEVKFKEAASWSIFYIGLAIAFGIWVWAQYGDQKGTEFFAAYLVEKSLSVDNLFVFVIILAQFAVPGIYHQRILLFGVILALVLRTISIAVGAHGLIWALTVISYRITQKSFENPNPQVSIRAIMGGFMIKFLVIALAAFIYIFLQRKLVNLPALYLAALFYILYTTIEVRLLLKQLKNRSDAEKRSAP